MKSLYSYTKTNSSFGRALAFRSALDKMLLAEQESQTTDAEWAVLLRWEYPRQFEAGEPDTLNDAYRFVTDARFSQRRPDQLAPITAKKRSSTRQAAKTSTRAWHDMALSRVFVAHATQADKEKNQFGFLRFRKEILGNCLVPRARAGTWVMEQAKRDGKATVHTQRKPFGQSWRIDTLAYCVDGDEWVHHVPVKTDGVLGRLREIADKLASFYGWSDAHASFFVLTGTAPLASSMKAKVSPTFPLASRTRIILDIHPTCTPQEVAQVFQTVKRRHFGRLRRTGAKHASLAAFFAEQPDEMSAKQLLDAWNAGCEREERSDWKYSTKDLARFTRDSKLALERLASLNGPKGIPRMIGGDG